MNSVDMMIILYKVLSLTLTNVEVEVEITTVGGSQTPWTRHGGMGHGKCIIHRLHLGQGSGRGHGTGGRRLVLEPACREQGCLIAQTNVTNSAHMQNA